MSDSPAVNKLPEGLQMEYAMLLSEVKKEIEPVEGLSTLHDMLLERFCFMYVSLRWQEQDPDNLDLQRYNQAHQIWLKVGTELLDQYKSVYSAGALNEIFASKVMAIVKEEVDDPKILGNINRRLETASKEHATP